MVRIQAENFSLDQIWQSGQCFRMVQVEHKESGNKEEARYEITAGGRDVGGGAF